MSTPKKKPAKKPAPAKKKPAAKKQPEKYSAAAPKRSLAKEVIASNEAKKEIKRPPSRVARRPNPGERSQFDDEFPRVDTKKAVAFAMTIAQEMKRSAAVEEAERQERRESDGVRLSRRPTSRSQGKSTVSFPASDLRDFRKRLLEARAEAAKGVDAMKAAGFNESDDREADGGDGTAQTLRLQALGQMGNINRTIQQIDEALHRIDDGTYGVCTACGQLIRKPRLLNQPFVLTCMECQSEMERAAK